MSLFKVWRNSTYEFKGEYNSFSNALEEYMYANEFTARILGEILRAKICKYGVEGYTKGADFVGGGNDATPTKQHENIDFGQTIESALSPTEHANE